MVFLLRDDDDLAATFVLNDHEDTFVGIRCVHRLYDTRQQLLRPAEGNCVDCTFVLLWLLLIHESILSREGFFFFFWFFRDFGRALQPQSSRLRQRL